MDVVTSADRPDLEQQAAEAFRVTWPEFVFHDPVATQLVSRVSTYFPQYDLLLLDGGASSQAGGGCRSPGTAAWPTCPRGTTALWPGR